MCDDKVMLKEMADGRPFKGYRIKDDEMIKFEVPSLYIMLK
jgi:hypothetical protein